MSRKTFLVVLMLLSSGVARATSYVVSGTMLSVYAQTIEDSTAHLIQSSVGIYNGAPHPSCGNRVYIDFSDNAVLAMALAASFSGKPVNFIYVDAAPLKTIAGHTTSTCRVISIFQ